MKRNIILILFFLSAILSAQNPLSTSVFNILEGRQLSDGRPVYDTFDYSKSILTSEKNIIYASCYPRISSEDSLFLEEMTGERIKLTVRDTNLNILNEWYSKSYLDSNSDIDFIGTKLIKEVNDEILVMGVGRNDALSSVNGYAVFKFRFNKSLELLEDTWFELPIDTGDSVFVAPQSIIINNNGNYVIGLTTLFNSDTEFPLLSPNITVLEMNEEGELLRYKDNLPMNRHTYHRAFISQMNDGYYVCNANYILDTAFNITDSLLVDGVNDNIPYVYPVDSSKFIYGGVHQVFNVYSDIGYRDDYVETISIGDVNGTVKNIMSLSTNRDSTEYNFKSGFMALSGADTNNIYIAMQRGFEIPYFHNHNYGTIFSVGIDGTLNWSYVFGDEEYTFYVPIDILTLPNGNCFLTIHKMGTSEGIYNQDLIYVILDKAGNVVNLTTSVIESPRFEANILAYPNPATENIWFSIDESMLNENLTVEIWSINGESLLSSPIMPNTPIDISHISSGIYIYSIYDGEKLIYANRLIVQ